MDMLAPWLALIAFLAVHSPASATPLTEKVAAAYRSTEFRTFLKSYARQYASDDEFASRYENFKNNLAYIEKLNKIHGEGRFGITKFADYSKEEMRRIGIKQPHFDESAAESVETSGAAIPTNFDWRDQYGVTPVKDQGDCGSCWAFASTAVIESMFAIYKKATLDLSEQELVECDKNSDGCNSGYPSSAYEVAVKKGMLKESDFPYKGVLLGTCPAKTGSYFISSVNRIQGNANAIADYVYNHGPVSVNFRITDPLYHHKQGLFSPSDSECASSNSYHVWTIVGFGEENGQKYWIIKNSWGADWGENGFVKYVRGRNACGVETYPYSAGI